MNWKLTWIVVGYAYFSSYHSGFQRKMQVALRKFVQIANMNSFVQEQ
jgi:hypothetical protein